MEGSALNKIELSCVNSLLGTFYFEISCYCLWVGTDEFSCPNVPCAIVSEAFGYKIDSKDLF